MLSAGVKLHQENMRASLKPLHSRVFKQRVKIRPCDESFTTQSDDRIVILSITQIEPARIPDEYKEAVRVADQALGTVVPGSRVVTA